MRLGQIGFSCWELIFAIFRRYPVPSIDIIFVFIEYVQEKYIFSNNTTVCVSISLYTALFLDGIDKTVFSCCEFKLENIYSGVNFGGNFYLLEIIFADR